MNADAAANRYLDAKKEYVDRLNNVIESNPTLWSDMIKNNFDQADTRIQDYYKTKLSESSKSLEQLFFSSHIDDDERVRIAELILSPSDRNAYIVKPPTTTIGNFAFLLIRKYDLPFIREFLRICLIIDGKVSALGFDGVENRGLFDKILTIGDKPLFGKIKDKDKFVLHSGVSFGRRDQHCPLIVSLERLMTQYHIPYDSSRPEVQHCLWQNELQTQPETFTTKVDDDGYAMVVPMPSTRRVQPPIDPPPIDPPPIIVLKDVENDVEDVSPVIQPGSPQQQPAPAPLSPVLQPQQPGGGPAGQPAFSTFRDGPQVANGSESKRPPNDAHFASGIVLSAPSAVLSPQDQFKNNPTLSALNVIGGVTTDITPPSRGFGGRRTKKRKLSKRMKKRVTRNRKQKKTRKSLRKHKH